MKVKSAAIGAGLTRARLAGNPRMTYTAFFQIQRPAFLLCVASIFASAVTGRIITGFTMRFQQAKAIPDGTDHTHQSQYFWERKKHGPPFCQRCRHCPRYKPNRAMCARSTATSNTCPSITLTSFPCAKGGN